MTFPARFCLMIFSLHLAGLLHSSSLLAGPKPSTPTEDFGKCGTWEILEGKGPALSPGIYPSRPPIGTYTLGSAHFKVHFGDTLLTDYAEQILQAAEYSYHGLLDSLGCLEPPSDGTNGGDGRTDFYVISASGASFWGQTVPEEPVSPWPYADAWTSFVEIIDTIPDLYVPTIVGHEYFHVVQLGYDKDEDIKFLEMISTWAEEYLYDDVNSYLIRLPAFFAQPQIPLMNWTYNNVPWAIFLSENFGPVIIRHILESCGLSPGGNSLAATDTELGKLGSSRSAEFARFTLWNYFTGPRDDGNHYEEGGTWPSVWIERDTECLPLIDYLTQFRPGPLASNFLTFLGDHTSNPLHMEIVLNPNAEWIVSVSKFISGNIYTEYDYYPKTVGWDPHAIAVDDWADCDSLLVIPNVVSTSGTSFEYIITAYHGDTAPQLLPYILVLDRGDCKHPFDGDGDDFTVADGEAYPIALALQNKSVRYVMSDSIPDDLSMCGAVFVIGGFNETGCNLQPAELQSLMDYMDAGRDVYLESTQLGSFIDPSQGTPTPLEEAFWGYFGCSFQQGDSMNTGNVSEWKSSDTSPVGAYDFYYDYQSPADDLVGYLLPDPGTDTLLVDQSGKVRGTVAYGPDKSERICSTVMLGASRGKDGFSSREDYLRSVLDLFDTIVPALAVSFVEVEIMGREVTFQGEIEGYNGEKVHMVRSVGEKPGMGISVPLEISGYGNRVRLYAVDHPEIGSYTYQIFAENGSAERELWRKAVSVGQAAPLFSLQAVTPNPSSGVFELAMFTGKPVEISLSVYDPLGRLVYKERSELSEGANILRWDARNEKGKALPSGIYFLRVRAGSQVLTQKLVLLR